MNLQNQLSRVTSPDLRSNPFARSAIEAMSFNSERIASKSRLSRWLAVARPGRMCRYNTARASVFQSAQKGADAARKRATRFSGRGNSGVRSAGSRRRGGDLAFHEAPPSRFERQCRAPAALKTRSANVAECSSLEMGHNRPVRIADQVARSRLSRQSTVLSSSDP